MTTSNETDIVDRLRDNAEVCFCTISRDAADEIERLRSEINLLRSLFTIRTIRPLPQIQRQTKTTTITCSDKGRA